MLDLHLDSIGVFLGYFSRDMFLAILGFAFTTFGIAGRHYSYSRDSSVSRQNNALLVGQFFIHAFAPATTV